MYARWGVMAYPGGFKTQVSGFCRWFALVGPPPMGVEHGGVRLRCHFFVPDFCAIDLPYCSCFSCSLLVKTRSLRRAIKPLNRSTNMPCRSYIHEHNLLSYTSIPSMFHDVAMFHFIPPFLYILSQSPPTQLGPIYPPFSPPPPMFPLHILLCSPIDFAAHGNA